MLLHARLPPFFASTLALASAARAQSTQLISFSHPLEGDSQSTQEDVSADGRFVLFWSDADNLVPGDTDLQSDLFVRDRLTQRTFCLSVDANGVPAGAPFGMSGERPQISADGRWVLFDTPSSSLVPGDTNGAVDVLLRDCVQGKTSRVSVGPAGQQVAQGGFGARMTDDGHFVVFLSASDDLVSGDTNGLVDAFVRDLVAGTVERVSLAAGGGQLTSGSFASMRTGISGDGRFVGFDQYGAEFVPGDTNVTADVFVYDRATGQNVRVSVDSAGNQADGPSMFGSISLDGRYVSFYSLADNLVPGDTNGAWDCFVRDLQLGLTSRISVGPAGTEGNHGSTTPMLSRDGRYVSFGSLASNWVPGDSGSTLDVFVRDLLFAQTTCVSLDLSGSAATGGCTAAPEGGGRYVVFSSSSPALVAGDTNAVEDVFVRDLVLGTTERVSVPDVRGSPGNNLSEAPSVSGDGRFVAFQSKASNLVSGDHAGHVDVFVRDRANGSLERASRGLNGAEPNSDCSAPRLSGDGQRVAYQSASWNLVSGDSNAVPDVFVFDRQQQQTLRASVDSSGLQADGASSLGCLDLTGKLVAFQSDATNLVAGDTNLATDVFVRDLQAGTTSRVSVASGGAQADGPSEFASISADGRFVAFQSDATNLVAGDTNDAPDVFVYDRQTGLTTRVSVDSSGNEGNGASFAPSISLDGRFVGFTSSSSNLVAGDTNGAQDAFVHDRQAGITIRVSVDSLGNQANGATFLRALSADGRVAALESFATNLVAGDTNGVADVFTHDLVSGATERASVDELGAQSNGASQRGALSGDGRCVVLATDATNLFPNDTNNARDIVLHDRQFVSPFTSICFGDGTQATPCPCGNNGLGGHGCDNSVGSGGAQLVASGTTALDSVQLTASGELPSALSVVLQGSSELTGVVFGDGVRCAGGALKRLYLKSAILGAVSVPAGGDLPINAQSALLGDPIAPGSTRVYQVYYRDPSASFCAAPQGNTWNVSNGVRVAW